MSQTFDLGVHFYLQHQYDRAARAFTEAARDEPQHPRVWTYLGVCLAHLGRAAEAEAALSRALRLTPQSPEAWFHLGIARGLREEWAEAAVAYRHAVALEPEDLVAWHRLGIALAESGEPMAAAAAFERALVLSRETGREPLEEPVPAPTSDSHLGEVGDREGSREAEGWLQLALSLLSLGEEEEAVSAYERAYTIDPQRARRSLFRPMLELVTMASGGPVPDDGPAPAGPERPRRRPESPPARPEVG